MAAVAAAGWAAGGAAAGSAAAPGTWESPELQVHGSMHKDREELS